MESRRSSDRKSVNLNLLPNRHNFVPYHFNSPTWCEVCNKFIWGLGKQGLRCKTCHVSIHKTKCLEGAPRVCMDKVALKERRCSTEILPNNNFIGDIRPISERVPTTSTRTLAVSTNRLRKSGSSVPEQNTHVFAPYHFSKPTWCALCGKFIWGVSGKQGYRCTVCKTAIHKTGRCMDILLSSSEKSTCCRRGKEEAQKNVEERLLENEVIMLHIFSYLEEPDLANVALVSQYFLSLVHDMKHTDQPTMLTPSLTVKRLPAYLNSYAKNPARPFQRMLVVTVIEAKDLEAKDDSSLSNPFVVIRMDKHQRRKTRVKHNTMFPNWGETFYFLLTGESNLRIHVWDWNLIAKKRSLGLVSIPLGDFIPRDFVLKETWFKLEPKSASTLPKMNRVKGEIKLTIESKPLATSESLLDRASFLSESEEEEEAIQRQFEQRRQRILDYPVNESLYQSDASLHKSDDPSGVYRATNSVPNLLARRAVLESALTFSKNAKTIELVASARIGDSPLSTSGELVVSSSPPVEAPLDVPASPLTPSLSVTNPNGAPSPPGLSSAGNKQQPPLPQIYTPCVTYDDLPTDLGITSTGARAYAQIYSAGYAEDDDEMAAYPPPHPPPNRNNNVYTTATNSGVYATPSIYSTPGIYSSHEPVYNPAYSTPNIYSTPGIYSASGGAYTVPGAYSTAGEAYTSHDANVSPAAAYNEAPTPSRKFVQPPIPVSNLQTLNYGDHVSLWSEDRELASNLGDWNFRYQRVMLMLRKVSEHNASGAEDVEVRRSLIQLSQDFLYTAKAYGKIIISEVYLPLSQKTIKPVDVGGIAGGEKYIIHNILFKFAVDSKGVYGGNDAAAAKAAGHDLKGLQSYVNCDIPGICTPFMVLVDYRGFRLIAMSILPIDKDTLIYGSANAGKTVANEDPKADSMMKLASKILNLKPHIIEDKVMYSAVDLEGHRGKDGCFYLVDFSRVMPPEAPRKDIRNAKLFRLLRPEFVNKFSKPLCSDAFSPATKRDKTHNEEVIQATEFLFKDTIPKFAKELAVLWSQEDMRANFRNFRLGELLHSRGINIRYLGLILATIENDATISNPILSVLFVIEMVARAIKNTIRTKLREKMKELRIPVEEPYRRLVIEYLNLVFGDTMQSELYWNNSIRSDIKRIFTGFRLKAEEDEFNFSLKQLITNYSANVPGMTDTIVSGKAILFARVRRLAGLKFSTLFEKELAEREGKLDGDRPFDEMDLDEVGERIKHTNTVQHAEGYMLVIKGMIHRSKSPTAAGRYFHLAIEKFQEALDSNSNSKVILRDCAQAMIYLYKENIAAAGGNNTTPAVLEQHRHLLEQANNYYLRAIDIDPSDPKSLTKYARFLDAYHDDLDTAEEYYIQALENNPDYTDGLFAYGAFLEAKRNEPEVAEKLYMRAKAIFVLEDQRQNAASKTKRTTSSGQTKKNYAMKMYRKESV